MRGILIFTVFFVILEFTFRLIGFNDFPLVIVDSDVEYLFAPNQKRTVVNKHFVTNSLGMRSQDGVSKADCSILVFGDSVVNGGIQIDQGDLATSWVNRVAQRETSSGDCIVGNVSAGSWGPKNWLEYYKKYIKFKPTLVVVVISGHDLTDLPNFNPIAHSTHPTYNDLLAIISIMRRFVPRYYPFFEEYVELGGLEPTSFIAEKEGRRALNNFFGYAVSKSPVISIYHETYREVSEGEKAPEYKVIRDISVENGVPMFDTHYYYSSVLNDGGMSHNDWIHLTEEGQLALSQCILEGIASRNEFLLSRKALPQELF